MARFAGICPDCLGAQMAIAFGSRIFLGADVEKGGADDRILSNMQSPSWPQLQEWLLHLRLLKISEG